MANKVGEITLILSLLTASVKLDRTSWGIRKNGFVDFFYRNGDDALTRKKKCCVNPDTEKYSVMQLKASKMYILKISIYKMDLPVTEHLSSITLGKTICWVPIWQETIILLLHECVRSVCLKVINTEYSLPFNVFDVDVLLA